MMAAFFITAGLAYQLPMPHHASWGWNPRYDLASIHNPYGTIEAGFSTDPDRRVTFAVSLRHQSSVPVNDWGENTINAYITWRPFK